MSTELEQRLRRLAPEVDVDLGRADLEVRQRRITRRRRLVGGAVLAASIVAIAGLAGQAARDRSPGSDDVTTASGDVTTAAGDTRTTTATVDGVEVTVIAPDRATAGTRLWFDVTVRNQGDAPVYWEAGGCGIPVQAAAGPSSTVALDTPLHDQEAPRWDGDVGGLGAWLADHDALATAQPHQPADRTGTRDMVCTAMARTDAIAPGEALHHRGSVELRVPPGALPDGGDYQLLVDFPRLPGRDASPDDHSLPPVEVRAPVSVTDDPGRADGDAASAVAAFAADPRLAEWIASTEVADRPDLVQDFATELSWWRGGWELWVDPRWEGGRRLRMRYGPAREQVVDVRTVYISQSPEDEPGRVAVTGEAPDEIL